MIIECKYCKDGKKARSKSYGEQGCSDPPSLTTSDNTWKLEITNFSVSQSADGTLSDKRHSPSPSNRCLLISRPVLPHTFCSSKQQLLFAKVWLSRETSKHCRNKQQQGQTALEGNNSVMRPAILIDPLRDEGEIADHSLYMQITLTLDFHENDFIPQPV